MLDQRDRFEWVNALRGYAVLLVILIHTSQHWYASEIVHFFSNNGDMGVQLFFVMSAFTLFNSYSKRKKRDATQVKRFFFLRRFFRIAPYYYAAGLLYIAWDLLWDHSPVNFIYVAVNYLFLNGIYLPAVNYLPPGGWSVGIEMLFYLMIPALFSMIKTLRNAVFLFIGAIGLSVILNLVAEHFLVGMLSGKSWLDAQAWEFYFWLPNQLPVFALGIILFFLLQGREIAEKTAVAVLVLSFAFMLLALYLAQINAYQPAIFQRHFVFSIGFVGMAVGLSKGQTPVNNKIVRKIGIVSFSVYLNHFIVLHLIDYTKYRATNFLQIEFHLPAWIWDNDASFIIVFLSVAAVTYAISTQTYKYVESRGIGFAELIIERFRKTAPA